MDMQLECTRSLFLDLDLASGRKIRLRSIVPSDDEHIANGIRAMSERSRYLRFFSGFRTAPPGLAAKLADVDGYRHIGWGVIDLSASHAPPIAAAHAIRKSEHDQEGEFAIAVLEDYQREGIAYLLIAVIFELCRLQGWQSLTVDVLQENRSALRLFKMLGAVCYESAGPVASYRIDIAGALSALRATDNKHFLNGVIEAVSDISAASVH